MKLSTSRLCTQGGVTLVSDRFPVKPDTTYIGGADIRVLKPGPAMVMSCQVYDRDGAPAMDSHSAFMAGMDRAAASGGWETAKNGMRTKTNAAWGQVTLSVAWGHGAGLFDNVWLREAPAGEPVRVRTGGTVRSVVKE